MHLVRLRRGMGVGLRLAVVIALGAYGVALGRWLASPAQNTMGAVVIGGMAAVAVAALGARLMGSPRVRARLGRSRAARGAEPLPGPVALDVVRPIPAPRPVLELPQNREAQERPLTPERPETPDRPAPAAGVHPILDRPAPKPKPVVVEAVEAPEAPDPVAPPRIPEATAAASQAPRPPAAVRRRRGGLVSRATAVLSAVQAADPAELWSQAVQISRAPDRRQAFVHEQLERLREASRATAARIESAGGLPEGTVRRLGTEAGERLVELVDHTAPWIALIYD